MSGSSQGYQSRLSIAAGGTAIGSYTGAYEIESETLKKTGTILDTNGLRGTRSHHSGRTREGTYSVQGTLNFCADPAMLDLLLPWILGADESTDVFALADTLPERDVLIDRVAKRFVYAGCKVNRARITGRAGELIKVSLDIIGKTETVSATSFPSITPPTVPPYAFQDAALTLVSTSRIITNFELTVDNVLDARFANSVSATNIDPQDRIITLRTETPFTSDEVDLYAQSVGGAAAALVLTYLGYSTTFSFASLQVPDNSPNAPGMSEILLSLEGVARMSGTTKELIVTHDSAA